MHDGTRAHVALNDPLDIFPAEIRNLLHPQFPAIGEHAKDDGLAMHGAAAGSKLIALAGMFEVLFATD
ncbi:hypothetical protein D3C83_309080 [compost metagenome]